MANKEKSALMVGRLIGNLILVSLPLCFLIGILEIILGRTTDGMLKILAGGVIIIFLSLAVQTATMNKKDKE